MNDDAEKSIEQLKMELWKRLAQEAAAHIRKLEAALREIASASKVVAKKEDMAEALAVLFSSHKRIALTALEGKE